MAQDPSHDNQISDWREMAGELIDFEIQALEAMELHGAQPDAVLAKARAFANERMLTAAFNLDPPEGAASWCQLHAAPGDGGVYQREFRCAERDFNGLMIRVQGVQRTDGSVRAELLARGHAQLTSEECRQLAAALSAAANEVDRRTTPEE